MSTKNRTILYQCEAGNGSGFYRAIFFNNGVNDFTLDICKIEEGEQEIEETRKEAQKVERAFIRPVMDGLSMDELNSKQKQILSYLKKNNLTPEEALVVDKKSKKSLIESGVKFPCEKIYIEETILTDVPVIKKEFQVNFKSVKKLSFYTKISNKDIRNTLNNFIQTL